MSTFKAIRNAIQKWHDRQVMPSLILNNSYIGLNFTNVPLRECSIDDRACFGHPNRSGIIDLGNPFGYRFIVVKQTDTKGKVSYMISTGCRWFTRDQALAHQNWQPGTKDCEQRVRDCLTTRRGGIKELLATVDQLAKTHWGYKIPKK